MSLARREWRLVVTGVLMAATFAGLQTILRATPAIPRTALQEFPQRVGMLEAKDIPIDAETQEILGATDLVNRVYENGSPQESVGLFIAFFESQRKGGAVHSPKNCLPGSGWSVLESGTTSVRMSGNSGAVEVNRYLVQKDLDKHLVLYWYQSQGRVIASEYSAKVYLVWDAVTNRRTDGALVRIATPVVSGDEAAALERAKEFASAIFPALPQYIPN
jgi:EpsI family protein